MDDCKALPWRAVIFSLVAACLAVLVLVIWLAVLVIYTPRILGGLGTERNRIVYCVLLLTATVGS